MLIAANEDTASPWQVVIDHIVRNENIFISSKRIRRGVSHSIVAVRKVIGWILSTNQIPLTGMR